MFILVHDILLYFSIDMFTLVHVCDILLLARLKDFIIGKTQRVKLYPFCYAHFLYTMYVFFLNFDLSFYQP
jgi:hypothetical protein